MLRDITIGQHFPGDSPVHRLDPRIKLVLTLVYIIVLFAVPNISGMLLAFAGYLRIFITLSRDGAASESPAEDSAPL